jgi:hypothetical protein
MRLSYLIDAVSSAAKESVSSSLFAVGRGGDRQDGSASHFLSHSAHHTKPSRHASKPTLAVVVKDLVADGACCGRLTRNSLFGKLAVGCMF